MRFILVEDDPRQAEALVIDLKAAFPSTQLTWVASEHDFATLLPTLEPSPPDLVLIDMMLQWARPSRTIPPRPAEVSEGGFRRAGLRCVKRLRRISSTRVVPVILYSALDRQDLKDDVQSLDEHVFVVHKAAEPESLVRLMRSVLQAQGSPIGLADDPDQNSASYARVAVCRRGHTVFASVSERSDNNRRLFCGLCGAPLLVACEMCNSPLRVQPDNMLAEGVGVFCRNCGGLFPWAGPRDRLTHLQNLLEFTELDEAEQLSVIEELSILMVPAGEITEDEVVQAGARIRRLAPRLWDAGLPVIQAVLTEAARTRLGL